ncbi:hypothetical protein ACH5RR_005274 [Cinchona calisaya]|uniref:SHSP domain-containing protein n=1 Tax=Cinchona calisaya TaxID=153742 RepID=A0ABD3AKY2_9GENT
MSLTTVFGGRRSNFYDPFPGDAWNRDPFNNNHQVQQQDLESGVIAAAAPVAHHGTSTAIFGDGGIEWKETPEAHIFKTDLPGVRREDVRVEVEDDKILKITGERFMENVEERHGDQYWNHVQRSRGKYLTAFRLPENSRIDQIRSTMENGVLTVRVPKWESKQQHHHIIPIQITG